MPQITDLDYDTILANLRTFMQSVPEFSDYNFTGSNLSALLRLLATNTHYMAYYLNMIANELPMATAIIPRMIYSHSKDLNYVPHSKTAAEATVSIIVTPDSYSDGTYTIPRYQTFQSEAIDGVNYQFVTTRAYNADKVSGVFTFPNVVLLQGNVITERKIVNNLLNPSSRMTLVNDSIDITTLGVAVLESPTSTNVRTFTRSSDLASITGATNTYFIEKSSDGFYTVYFGDDNIGVQLDDGNIIVATYIATDAAPANGAKKFAVSLAGGVSASATTIDSAAGGDDEESLDSIKFSAPLYNTAQQRCVGEADFSVLVKSDFPKIASLSVWGGEDNDPPIYGKVFISANPKAGYALSSADKKAIVNKIKTLRGILGINPEILDPKYTYLKLSIAAEYNATLTTLSANQIRTLMQNAVVNYNTTKLGQFQSKFVKSKVETALDAVDASVTGSDVKIVLEKRFTPVTNKTNTYLFNFESKLQRGSSVYGLSSSQFAVFDTGGVLRNVYFDESPLAYTGIDSIEVTDPGYGFLSAPTVMITGDGTGASATAKIVNGKVQSITITNRGINYNAAQVTITGGNGQGAVARPFLLARYGTVRTYYYNDRQEKIFINSNAGTIDYDSGLITLQNFNPAQYDNYIALRIPTDNSIIETKRGNICVIDITDATAVAITLTEDH